jgi:hypothetical protein
MLLREKTQKGVRNMLRSRLGRPAVGTIVVLSGWMILSSSIVTLAEQRCDNRRNQWRFSPRGGTHRPADYFRPSRDQRYCRNKKDSQYRQYNRGRDYNRYQDSRRYREYDRWYGDYGRERSGATSALIVAGSTGAGAAVGAIAAGSKGAAIGAIAGGIGGLIYDRQTDNRR